jgi:hypothetical protein
VDLFDAFSTDIIARYIHYRSHTPVPVPAHPPVPTHPHAPVPVPAHPQSPAPVPVPGQELRIGYILYIEADANINIKSKMNKLLNYMVQLKNPNIYVKSHWVIDELGINAGLVQVNKIKVKVIVLENNKDYAIKMLINELIYNIKKKDRKYSKYLEKVDTSLPKTS